MSLHPHDLIVPGTGTAPVLRAPDHIRGPIGRWAPTERHAARIAWLKSIPIETTGRDIGKALGIGESAAQRLKAKHAPNPRLIPCRHTYMYRGLRLGDLRSEILDSPWSVQGSLEAHCARTGQSFAEALVEFWETHHG